MNTVQRFNVALAFPWNNECFEEIIRNVAAGLREMGHSATEEKRYVSGAQNIIVGHYINPVRYPTNTILYQLEPYNDFTVRIGHIPLGHLRPYRVWDYSRYNITRLREQGIKAIYAPAGKSSAMVSIPTVKQDIDVLFYGGMHPRRVTLIEELKRRRLKVVTSIHAYRNDLAALIARAKVVLNMHGAEGFKTHESWRVVYPLSFGKAVVTEVNPGDDLDGFASAALCVPYRSLTDACVYLVNSEERRHELGETARQYMDTRLLSTGLRTALEETYGRN